MLGSIQGVRVKESTVFSRKYCTEVTNLSTLSVFEVEIWCFRGGDEVPKWILRGAGKPPRSVSYRRAEYAHDVRALLDFVLRPR